MSRRVLGENTLLSFRQINQSSLNCDGLCVCKQRKGCLFDCLFTRDDFDCSVIHTLGNDKSKAVIGGVTVPQRWREHFPENGS